jgi:pimeloyl-ACP methyl ester carboxylesterase
MFCTKFGKGDQILLALHGFGDKGSQLLKWSSILEEKYSVIAPDLPFHGATPKWEPYFNVQHLLEELIALLPADWKERKITLLCHSMGARIVQEFMLTYPDTVLKIIFLAPAGFHNSLSDHPLLFPQFVRKFIFKLLPNTKTVHSFFKLGLQLRLINKANYDFLIQQMASRERIDKLFYCWISLASFRVSLKGLKNLIVKHEVKLIFVYGKRDFITPYQYGEKFCKKIDSASLILVDEGHYLVKESLQDSIISIF